jgi:AraC-like DNA-binding protein
MLRAGESEITRLAIDLSFSSHSHFTRAFTAAFGINPSAYRDEAPEVRTIVQDAAS